MTGTGPYNAGLSLVNHNGRDGLITKSRGDAQARFIGCFGHTVFYDGGLGPPPPQLSARYYRQQSTDSIVRFYELS